MNGAAFELEPARGGDPPEVITVSPVAQGQTTLGTSALIRCIATNVGVCVTL